jgi:hypothetical protein
MTTAKAPSKLDVVVAKIKNTFVKSGKDEIFFHELPRLYKEHNDNADLNADRRFLGGKKLSAWIATLSRHFELDSNKFWIKGSKTMQKENQHGNKKKEKSRKGSDWEENKQPEKNGKNDRYRGVDKRKQGEGPEWVGFVIKKNQKPRVSVFGSDHEDNNDSDTLSQEAIATTNTPSMTSSILSFMGISSISQNMGSPNRSVTSQPHSTGKPSTLRDKQQQFFRKKVGCFRQKLQSALSLWHFVSLSNVADMFRDEFQVAVADLYETEQTLTEVDAMRIFIGKEMYGEIVIETVKNVSIFAEEEEHWVRLTTPCVRTVSLSQMHLFKHQTPDDLLLDQKRLFVFCCRVERLVELNEEQVNTAVESGLLFRMYYTIYRPAAPPPKHLEPTSTHFRHLYHQRKDYETEVTEDVGALLDLLWVLPHSWQDVTASEYMQHVKERERRTFEILDTASSGRGVLALSQKDILNFVHHINVPVILTPQLLGMYMKD